MKSARDLLSDAAIRLGGGDARLEAELLLALALGQSRAWLYAHADDAVGQEAGIRFEGLVTRRAGGEPIAYLTGRREFWSLDFAVTPDVLIPRRETELLVELALTRIPADRDCAIADLGTGCGAIALALAHERPRARVLATDASAAALAIARGNARRLGITNVAFAEGDWCVALGSARFDLIASNPPYIESGDPHLGEGDLRCEPASALASGSDGLDAIRAIVGAAPAHLAHGGSLLLEHGWDQAASVRALLEACGLRGVQSRRDGAGHERVTLGQVQSG